MGVCINSVLSLRVYNSTNYLSSGCMRACTVLQQEIRGKYVSHQHWAQLNNQVSYFNSSTHWCLLAWHYLKPVKEGKGVWLCYCCALIVRLCCLIVAANTMYAFIPMNKYESTSQRICLISFHSTIPAVS